MLDDKEEQTSELLQKKPQRQTGWHFMPFLVLPGMIIILGAVFVGAWQVYTTNSASSSTTPPAYTKGDAGKGNTGNNQPSWDNYPEVYWHTLRAQFAQGLHMTEQQVQNNLQATLLTKQTSTNGEEMKISSVDAAKWLNDLAQAQSISQDQIHTIESTAVQQAHAVLVQQHVLTQQQADETIHGMNQDDLHMHIVEAFFMCSQGKKSCQASSHVIEQAIVYHKERRYYA